MIWGLLLLEPWDASIRKNLALLAATGCTLWCYPLLQPRAAATVVELSFRLSLNPLTFPEKGSCRDSNWTASTVFWVMSHPTFLVMNHYSTISAAQNDPKKLLLSTKHPGRKVKLGGPRAGENHIESFRKVLGFARLNLFVHEFLRVGRKRECVPNSSKFQDREPEFCEKITRNPRYVLFPIIAASCKLSHKTLLGLNQCLICWRCTWSRISEENLIGPSHFEDLQPVWYTSFHHVQDHQVLVVQFGRWPSFNQPRQGRLCYYVAKRKIINTHQSPIRKVKSPNFTWQEKSPNFTSDLGNPGMSQLQLEPTENPRVLENPKSRTVRGSCHES